MKKNLSLKSKFKQNGSFMAEYGLVLIISILVLVGVILKFSSNTTATQTNQLSGDITSLIGKVKSSYANNYNNVSNAGLNTGGFFRGLPSLNNNAGVVSTNIGGGTLVVAPGTVTSAGDSVQYTITQVPDDACLPFATAMSSSSTILRVNANTVKAVGAPANPAQIVCADDSNTVTLIIQ